MQTMPHPATRFTASDARAVVTMRQLDAAQTLGVVRQMCDAHLREAARVGDGEARFDVPTRLVGHPGYDPCAMGKSLARQLHDDGYTVTGTALHLVITWRKRRAKKTTSSAPVASAPSPPTQQSSYATSSYPTTSYATSAYGVPAGTARAARVSVLSALRDVV